ncbi:MAG: hypothetical protein KR126chlam6_01002 [Candidatus Anoxychlamydiales bacterium]|nr:hypothetical protein [Candidatus Anoxychlamydiales bacterium]
MKILFFTSLFFYLIHVNLFAFEQISVHENNKSYQGILCITVSKSGTNLLKVILENLLDIKPIGPTASYSKDALNKLIYCNQPYFFHPIEENVYWYVFDYPKAQKILLLRDPRDAVISLVDFLDKAGTKGTEITKIWPQLRLQNADWMKYDRKKKIKAILNTDSFVRSFNRIDEIIGKCENTYVCKFEKLISNKSCNVEAILDLAKFLEIPINFNDASLIAQNSYGSPNSSTFFKGVSGRWKEEFDEELKILFKQNPLNQYLLRWDYEKNNAW